MAKTDTSLTLSGNIIKKALFDAGLITVVYLIPAISHFFGFPFYLFDPMRIMVILAIVFTSSKNTYFIAATLPIFSFLISAHPPFLKALIMCGELSFNVWLFFFFSKRINSLFFSMFMSILSAKILYYSLKEVVVYSGLLQMDLVSTPLYIQLIIAVVLSVLIQFTFNIKEKRLNP